MLANLMKKVIKVSVIINQKYNLKIQETCWIKITYYYFPKKKINIKA